MGNITYTDPRETHPFFRYPTLLNMGETDFSLHEAPMHTLPTQRPHGDTLAQRRAPVRDKTGRSPSRSFSVSTIWRRCLLPSSGQGVLEERRAGARRRDCR